jgi:hypothetical protein
VVDQTSSKDRVVLAESVDVAINDSRASTTCFSRLTALLNAAMSLHQFVDGVQTDSRLPLILGLLVQLLGLPLPKMKVNLAAELMVALT